VPTFAVIAAVAVRIRAAVGIERRAVLGIDNTVVVIVFVADVTSAVNVAVNAVCEHVDRAARTVVTPVAVCISASRAVERGAVLAVEHSIAVVIDVTRIADPVSVVVGPITRWPRSALAF
jgi:hypothetical protein